MESDAAALYHTMLSQTHFSLQCVTQTLTLTHPLDLLSEMGTIYNDKVEKQLNFQPAKIFTGDLVSSGQPCFGQCPLRLCIYLCGAEGMSCFPPTGAPGLLDIPGGQCRRI